MTKKNQKILIILLVIVIIGAGMFWLHREKVFSNDVLQLEIVGPKSISMGDEVEYTVKYKNTGNFVL